MTADPAPAAPAAQQPDRLLSLDVMRGATVLAMILVNNPGSWGALYAPLAHAYWRGCTPTDLVFPFFLFMVGVAMAYSFAKYTTGDGAPTVAVWARIARRVATLILLGLLLNGSGKLWSFLLGYSDAIDLSTLRWPGVLQRIALAYLGASVVVLALGYRGRVAAAVVLLLAYTVALQFLPIDAAPADRMTPQANVVRDVDVAVIGEPHMWSQRPTDPEGLLSTLPSIVTALIGYAVGRHLKDAPLSPRRVGALLLGGLLLTGAGLAWDAGPHPGWGMPINKALWTPSFVLYTGGLATLALSACLLVFDVLGRRLPPIARLATPFQMVGVNAIFVFVASGLVARLLTTVRIGDATLKGWFYDSFVIPAVGALGSTDPRLASLVFAVGFVACWWAILWVMWRRGWTIRV